MSAILKLVAECFNNEINHFEETYDVEFPTDASLEEQIKFVEDIDDNHTILACLKAEVEYNELIGGLSDIDDTLNQWGLGQSDSHDAIKELLKKHE